MHNKNAAECLQLGEELFKSRRFKEAVEQFHEYVWLNPNDAAGHRILGMAYCELGEFAQAVDPFLRALRLGPESAEDYYVLGLAYSELQQHENAARAFSSAIRFEPDNAANHCGLATSYLQLHRPAEAMQHAKEALRLKPDSADAYLQLACALHFDQKTFVEAAAAYQKSLELEPGQFVALANLGDVNLRLGRIEEARDSLMQARKINPSDPKLHHLLGRIYLRLGRRDEALREHEILKSLDSNLADALAQLLHGQPSGPD
jgi:tetratricopeptide (TPR) repeat protein